MSSLRLPIFAVVALTLTCAHAAEPMQSAQQLVKDVVYNELADHDHHGFFQYLDQKRTGQQSVTKLEVETRSGRVSRMLASDGRPLSGEQQQQESQRLDVLLHDPGQQQKLLHEYQGDEERIARIVRLLPEGFLYEADGVEGEDIRLKYRPNPVFKPPTYEGRVFHAMAGTLWINGREKRLSRLRGQLISNVDFGYGLLGRLDKGGTFDMQRVEATPGNWKTRVLNVHITGHVILLKSIGKEQDEIRSDFRQVASDLSLKQAEAVLLGSVKTDEIRSVSLGSAAPPETEKTGKKESAALALK